MSLKSEAFAVFVALVLLAAIAVPNCQIPPRRVSPINVCISNLKQIQGAIEQYAMENKLLGTDHVAAADISGGTNKMITPLINVGLACPAGGFYTVTSVQEPPRCSVPGHTL